MMTNVVRKVGLKLLQKGTSSQKEEKGNRFKVAAHFGVTVIVS